MKIKKKKLTLKIELIALAVYCHPRLISERQTLSCIYFFFLFFLRRWEKNQALMFKNCWTHCTLVFVFQVTFSLNQNIHLQNLFLFCT